MKSPGVEAWLLSRENAAVLFEQLKARGDFREHSAPRVEIANGQSQTLARTQPRPYTRSVQLKQEFPFYDLIPGQDRRRLFAGDQPADVAGWPDDGGGGRRASVDQVEKLVPLAIDVPVGGQTQRVQIQVPQVVSWRLSERFRWPASEVLLLSCGVVAESGAGRDGHAARCCHRRWGWQQPGRCAADDRASAAERDERRAGAAERADCRGACRSPSRRRPAATFGTPTGAANSVSRGRY